MRFGLNNNQFESLQKLLTAHLLTKYPSAKIWMFGSRSRGDHKLHSDVDLLIEASAIAPVDLSILKMHLEESSFPYKVDIVLEQDLAESFRAQVNADKKLLFG